MFVAVGFQSEFIAVFYSTYIRKTSSLWDAWIEFIPRISFHPTVEVFVFFLVWIFVFLLLFFFFIFIYFFIYLDCEHIFVKFCDFAMNFNCLKSFNCCWWHEWPLRAPFECRWWMDLQFNRFLFILSGCANWRIPLCCPESTNSDKFSEFVFFFFDFYLFVKRFCRRKTTKLFIFAHLVSGTIWVWHQKNNIVNGNSVLFKHSFYRLTQQSYYSIHRDLGLKKEKKKMMMEIGLKWTALNKFDF